MALGNTNVMDDSSTLVAASAVAVGVILALLVLLAVLRARHAALQRRYVQFVQREYDARVALMLACKPSLHSVLLSPSCDVAGEDEKEKTPMANPTHWNEMRPLCVAAKPPNGTENVPSTSSTVEVGVFIRLPRLEVSNVTQSTGSGTVEDSSRGNSTSLQASDYDIVLGSSIPVLSGRSS